MTVFDGWCKPPMWKCCRCEREFPNGSPWDTPPYAFERVRINGQYARGGNICEECHMKKWKKA